MGKVFLFEDHDVSLKIWRKNRIKGLDLVHVDAHMDFGFHEAEPVDAILAGARSVAELKRKLEYSQAYSYFEKDLSKQIDIGNYIYPAMLDGIVRDFYWVVPGGSREFAASVKTIAVMLRQLIRMEGSGAAISHPRRDLMAVEILGRRLYVCTLDSLPVQKKPAILDIDVDFLVIKSVITGNNTYGIGKRNMWMTPGELVERLRRKVHSPAVVTIAYSCKGGYTPMKFRYLGDELAFLYDPGAFRSRFKKSLEGARLFKSFLETGKKEYYRRAARSDPAYRSQDNNYGLLYMLARNYRSAEREFNRIRDVDPSNQANWAGLGWIAVQKKEYKKARKCFQSSLRGGYSSFCKEERINSILGLARAEYMLDHLEKAKRLSRCYMKKRPLDPLGRYLSGRIAHKQGDFDRAAGYYIESLRLGYGGTETLYQLAKISFRCREKKSIIEYVKQRLARIKNEKKFKSSKKIKKLIVLLDKCGGNNGRG
ncbi:MAG: UPF0489 family protein [Candidatus Omnitrophota bacterium]